jgi:hypothetical protein
VIPRMMVMGAGVQEFKEFMEFMEFKEFME